jgi:hypothetical protein
MSTLDLQNVDVLNYNNSEVHLNTSNGSYKINEVRSDGTPTLITLPINEIKYIASNTEVFNIGILTFDNEHKEQIFNELSIKDWKNILSNEDIKNILLKPNQDGLQKILDIKNPTYFDRVRVILHTAIADGLNVSARVVDIVNRRYDELANRIRNTRIKLVEKDTKSVNVQEDVNEIKAQNELLQAQMAEMQKMMAEMLKAQASNTTVAETSDEMSESTNEKEESVAKPAPKKPGRPAKNKK